MKFEGNQFYVKSGEEMLKKFGDAPRASAQTVAIAERCNVRLEKFANPFPHFEVPTEFTLDSYFEHVTRQGFARRMKPCYSRQMRDG